MPWRLTRDPYRIWLSEIMLQQTQVATVIPYYERFVKRFPTVRELASAPMDDVLKLWSGLGYYSRARNLHRGAQVVVDRFHGVIPDTPELILEVPGIGPYTAGAILSIAFQKPVALVDGNVARVLSRMQLIDGGWRKSVPRAALWKSAGQLAAACATARLRPGDLNQAMMELGATVCTPRSPDCPRCPVSAHCLAFKHGKQVQYPQIDKKSEVPRWRLRAWIIRDVRGKMLFAQRQHEGLFGGLWEAPTEKRLTRKTEGEPPVLGRIKHVLSHRELDIQICSGEHAENCGTAGAYTCWSGNYIGFKWLTPELAMKGNDIALSSVQKKVLAIVLKTSICKSQKA